jgi:hypothetical protein
VSDSSELQEILENSPEPSKYTGIKKTTLSSAIGNMFAMSMSVEKTEEKEMESPSELTQWAVYPGSRFTAIGSTKLGLPAGAYTISILEGCVYFVAKKMLTDNLIQLDDSNSIQVIEGIQLFWQRKQKFLDRGVLFKRGILMWGPPGSGKTVTLTLLVEDLINRGGIVLLVQSPGAAVLALEVLRKIEPNRPLIVVLEDVEEIIKNYGEHDLLALLDGEHKTDNVVNIATTNYPEMLGARIINRPSRFDEVIKIGMPSPGMRKQYLKHVLRNEKEKYPIDRWVKDTDTMSIAHLKELVVAVTCLEQPYDQVINRLKSMKNPQKSTVFDNTVGFVTAAQQAGAQNKTWRAT